LSPLVEGLDGNLGVDVVFLSLLEFLGAGGKLVIIGQELQVLALSTSADLAHLVRAGQSSHCKKC
jgi:hypothetical protein